MLSRRLDELALWLEEAAAKNDTAAPDTHRAAAVCAAVEAFQAAEQALREAQRKQPFSEADWAAAVRGGEAAKARLLEVNLG